MPALSSLNSTSLKKQLRNLFLILLGNTVYALGIVLFVLPQHLITGGTTGLALSMDHFSASPSPSSSSALI